MNVKAYIITEVFDKNGKRIYYKRRRSRSFVQGFIAGLWGQFFTAATTGTFNDTGGVARKARYGNSTLAVVAASGDATLGIVVGTGSTAVAVTDYILETLIAHGVGSGQLSYSAVSQTQPSISDPNASFTFQRDMTNSSGAAITVWEEGVYAIVTDDAGATRKFCIIRDVESSGISVADGENLRVTYTIQTST